MCNLPPHWRVVEWRYVKDVFSRATFEGEGEPDQKKRDAAIRQAMKRAGERLVGLQIMGRASPYVWLTGKPVHGFRRPPRAPLTVISGGLADDPLADDIPLM
jgi:hypothetical protein